MINQGKRLVLLALMVVLLTEGGCSLFAGAASMRIEVEVYTGPLSKEPELQLAELIGLVEEYKGHMTGHKILILAFARHLEMIKEDESNFDHCDATYSLIYKLIPRIGSFIGRTDCIVFDRIYDAATQFEKELGSLVDILDEYRSKATNSGYLQSGLQDTVAEADLDKTKKKVNEALTRVGKLSSAATAKAFTWAISTIPGASPNFFTRIVMVNFIVASSEMGRQLNARADALLKQMGVIERREMPLSVQLRDTNATEFVRLYDWLKAHAPDFLTHFPAIGQPGTALNRVNAVHRLFTDNHWSTINTVYASGWGKGSMALIKDDIGNWNLKSFDSDPEDLLRAYKTAAIAAVETVAKAAKSGATGGAGAAADKLLDVALQYVNSSSFTSSSGTDGSHFRLLDERTALKLQSVKSLANNQKSEEDHANNAYMEALKALSEMKKDDPNYVKQEESVQKAKQVIIARRMETIQKIEKILNEHSELVDLFAKGPKDN